LQMIINCNRFRFPKRILAAGARYAARLTHRGCRTLMEG
jgi:hypothetical protein